MRRLAAAIMLIAVFTAGPGSGAFAKSKSRAPIASKVKGIEMSPQELRVRVRALIRPTLGIIEESADGIIAETKDRTVRRGALVWKIETTTTLLSAMLRDDPVLALADAWAYVLQVQGLLRQPEAVPKYGEAASTASEALTRVEAEFREFAGSVMSDSYVERFVSVVKQWADRHPIQGTLYRRPSVDSAVAEMLASSGGGGTLAAIGSLQETTADVMARMDLYTMYLPRLARWEGEIAVDDLTQGLDTQTLATQIDLFTRGVDGIARALDRIASVAEAAPDLVSRERMAALESVRGERLAVTEDLKSERRAVLEAVQNERIATLREVDAIAQRISDRSGPVLDEAMMRHEKAVIDSVEAMRRSLIYDSQEALEDVVDHAFFRIIELILIGAVLMAAGLWLYLRFLHR